MLLDFDESFEVIVVKLNLFIKLDYVILLVDLKIFYELFVFINEVLGHGMLGLRLRLVLGLDRFLRGFFGFIDMRRWNLKIGVVLLLVCD